MSEATNVNVTEEEVKAEEVSTEEVPETEEEGFLTEEQIKELPGKDLKIALDALNEWRKTKDLEEVNSRTKAEAVNGFIEAINDAVAADEATNLPDVVIDFYNNHLVKDTPEETPVVEAKKEKEPKEKKAKKEKAAKTPKAPKEPKVPKEKKEGREAFTRKLLLEKKTDAEIIEALKKPYLEAGQPEEFAMKRAKKYLNQEKIALIKEGVIAPIEKPVVQKAPKEPKPEKEKKVAPTAAVPAAKKPAPPKQAVPAAKKPETAKPTTGKKPAPKPAAKK